MDKILEEVKGTVNRVTYRNKDNGYTVISVKVNKETLVAAGIMPYVCEGDAVILHGQYTVHPAYGRQFRCDLCEVSVPQTQAQILKYLSSGAIKGVGPATALKLVERFKDNILDIIENYPTKLTAVKGISTEKAMSISEQYKQQFGMRDIMMSLSRYKISPNEASAIYKILGIQSMDIIKNNPYTLCTDGINFAFERVDEIAENFDIKPENQFRIAAGIEYVLKSNLSNGHTCLPRTKLIQVSSGLLNVDQEVVCQCLDASINSMIFYEYCIDDAEYVFLPEYAAAEEYIASRINTSLNNNIRLFDISEPELLFVQNRLGIEFDPVQIDAVNQAMRNSLFVLTGGPGTGKTTTLNAIIEIFDNRNLSIALAAPTGRAAKRMTELTGRSASTLHRLLEVEWDNGSKPYFARNRKNPLDFDVIIVDEMSMVDVQLFRALLEAVRTSARLVLVGDSDQLPSVGAGNILGDLISSHMVPFVRLEKIFRQEGDSNIVAFAHNIINGMIPQNYEKSADFYFLKRNDVYSSVKTVSELCCERLPNAYGYSPMEDIQVLCPSKKKECGTVNLNIVLQDKLNPLKKNDAELFYKGSSYRVGDKVMHIKNDYDIVWESDTGESGMGVFNGDIGFIEHIDVAGRMLKVRFDDRVATYYEENIGLLELAYAITVHKSQGCEFDCVVIPLFDTSMLLRYRNLLYTAITRAKKLIVLVGDTRVFEDMIENDRKALRYTALKHFIEGNR